MSALTGALDHLEHTTHLDDRALLAVNTLVCAFVILAALFGKRGRR